MKFQLIIGSQVKLIRVINLQYVDVGISPRHINVNTVKATDDNESKTVMVNFILPVRISVNLATIRAKKQLETIAQTPNIPLSAC